MSAGSVGDWGASGRCSQGSAPQSRRSRQMRRQPSAKPVAEPIDRLEIAGSLDERGYATTPQLLTRGECREIVALYPREEVFRSRVIMQRHAFGRGEYQYFRYPLPWALEPLPEATYPNLAPIANRWRERLNEEGRVSPTPAAHLRQMPASTHG